MWLEQVPRMNHKTVMATPILTEVVDYFSQYPEIAKLTKNYATSADVIIHLKSLFAMRYTEMGTIVNASEKANKGRSKAQGGEVTQIKMMGVLLRNFEHPDRYKNLVSWTWLK